ncbi:Rhamnogalacturonate lyase family protein [Striga hermonthica]|uniref:rhamnogalacturonan endolyase n=1 Tax=Striga hermonthica TaxID=68872 RepID=A0A9N7MPZ7_STRHE|nr:Rhamnogalacturonate lyase family protein [Striga hermonthica]
MDNGIVKLELTKPSGLISGISYGGVNNVLEYKNKETQRGLHSTSFRVISLTKEQLEVSFNITWNVSLGVHNASRSFRVLLICNIRTQERFHYMVISDDRQRIMPTDDNRKQGRTLDYKEAVLVRNPVDSKLIEEVDDKYQYSCENKDSHVHGWISANRHVGFWVITPSDEFRAGGPVKPDLTSHAGPTSLAIFFSNHYSGPTFGVTLRNGEQWKKVFGPVFIYLNSNSVDKPSTLWEDAKKQMSAESKKWPYDFPLSNDFPRSNQRGTFNGRLLVNDRYINKDHFPAKSAYVGLARPGDVGSWQDDAEGYQFWTQTDENGYFRIRNIRSDTYNLYAWVPGFIGDFRHDKNVTIRSGEEIQIGELVYDPPRNGPTLWEIGIPDRTASEFYISDPAPEFMNKLYIKYPEKFRQYGLWDRYTDLYPTHDLGYLVGVSDFRKDWFFAHVNRKADKKKYMPTTWNISFDVKNVSRNENYTLRLALASATLAEIQVRVNDPNRKSAQFTTGRIGKDNAIARHGNHGRYWLYSVNVMGSQLVNGNNIIYLKQARGGSPFTGVMYDYIRLEGPSTGLLPSR